MTDITNNESGEEELIPVETPPEEAKPEGETPTEEEAEGEDEDDGDTSDERIGESEDDNDDDVASNRKRRQKRREVQRAAKERAQRELEFLRRKVAELEQRQGRVEGHVVDNNVQSLEAQLAKAKQEAMLAEQVFVKATAANNTADAQQALQIRDEARDTVQKLTAVKQQLEQAKTRPQVDPTTANYAKQWIEANPWYDPAGRDADSALAKDIDNQLAREGYNPATRQYWEELTARVANAFGTSAASSAPAPKAKPKTPPPTGGTRQHAPTGTKNEIYVTPERKQAMIDAGAWDDPVKRQKMLKAYLEYDRSSAR